MTDPQIQQLSIYEWRAGPVYASPAYNVRVPVATFATVYHVTDYNFPHGMTMQGYHTTLLPKVKPTTSVQKPLGSNLGTITGAAPTSGIYTQIPSGCNSASGVNGSHYS